MKPGLRKIHFFPLDLVLWWSLFTKLPSVAYWSPIHPSILSYILSICHICHDLWYICHHNHMSYLSYISYISLSSYLISSIYLSYLIYPSIYHLSIQLMHNFLHSIKRHLNFWTFGGGPASPPRPRTRQGTAAGRDWRRGSRNSWAILAGKVCCWPHHTAPHQELWYFSSKVSNWIRWYLKFGPILHPTPRIF